MRKRLLIIAVTLVLLPGLAVGCQQTREPDRIEAIVAPYSFSIAQWEVSAIISEIHLALKPQGAAADEIITVTGYFTALDRIRSLQSAIADIRNGQKEGDIDRLETELNSVTEQRTALAETVEGILERQLRDTARELGIMTPLDRYIKLSFVFPPLNFELEKPPYLLVISPRNSIERLDDILLRQDIDLKIIEDVEAGVDALDLSALVVPLGGIASYPAFVDDEASLQFILNAAAEEWIHQYLAFTPLGFSYLLHIVDIARNYQVATINETVAGTVAKEIGGAVYQKFYSDYGAVSLDTTVTFDFNHEMREIRKTVDNYLARREVAKAEAFMEERRQYLASQGYNIRKLNQAYFAFYGTYADSPTSIDPIGTEVAQLRSHSVSLSDFLDRVSGITSRDVLRELLNETGQ